MFKEISIKNTLKIFAIFVVLSFLIIGILGNNFMEKVDYNINKFQNNEMNILLFSEELEDMLFEVQNVILYQFSLKINSSSDNFELVEEKFPSILEKLNKFKEIANRSKDEELIKISKNLNMKYLIFASNSIELFTSDINNKNLKEHFEKLTQTNEATNAMNKELNKLSSYLDNSLNNTFVELKRSMKENRYYIVILSLLIILFLLVSFFLFSNSLIKKLEKLTNGMKRFKNGDLSHRIKELKDDELSTIGHSFNDMAESLEINILEKEKKHKLLVEESKKVEAKTIELQNFNNNLEEKIAKEIQKNKAKEKLLFEQSKMASMGEMISNIAHQWRQPLSIISTAASGLKIQKEHDMLTDNIFEDSIDKIVDTTDHLSQTIDDFRNYFKKSKKKELFSIKNIIDKNLSLMHSSFKSNHIDIIILRNEDAEVFGYANEFVQALLNILNNAKDALSSQDKIIDKYIFIEHYKENDNIIITIKDTAGGIPKLIIGKIFEPYFTTKHKSQGTGIGLYMTRQIIVDHMNGLLEVNNESFYYEKNKFEGARFKITLPVKKS